MAREITKLATESARLRVRRRRGTLDQPDCGLAWRRLLKKKIAMVALVFILMFYALGIRRRCWRARASSTDYTRAGPRDIATRAVARASLRHGPPRGVTS